MSVGGKSGDRNARLFSALTAVRVYPGNASAREAWVVAAMDLVQTVLALQFGSLKHNPQREDLEQAALLEFHRVAPKLAAMTETYTPDALFRVLYSVAKFSMLRELGKLRKNLPPAVVDSDGDLRPADFEDMPEESDEGHPSCEGPHAEVEEESVASFARTVVPAEVARRVDAVSVYAGSALGGPVRFCALQRLRGRYVSPSFVRTMWRDPRPTVLVDYGELVARAAVLAVSNSVRLRAQAAIL